MQRETRILLNEDILADAILIQDTLRAGGIAFRINRVETREAFLSELTRQSPDLILSDHGLPSFDGLSALAIAREKCPDVPFIFVAGAIPVKMVIDTIRAGATDYVLKGQMADNLAPVVRRALQEAEEHRARKKAEAEIGALLRLLPACPSCKKRRMDHWYRAQLARYFREHPETFWWICPECREKSSRAGTRRGHSPAQA